MKRFSYHKNINIRQPFSIFNIIKKEHIIKTIKKYKEYKDYKNIPYNTVSTGLLIDSLVVCSSIENESKYDIYYESYESKQEIKDSYIFVNIDCTNFNLLSMDKNSPHNILCKNIDTYNILKDRLLNKNVLYTGFTSLDRYNPDINKDYRSIIHNAGKSEFKGTTCVVNVWRKNPDFPLLTIICRNKDVLNRKDIASIKNIKLIDQTLSEEQINTEINKHGIHLCPSMHEGFGHYINEARSTKSVVLYTNSPPMQELFTDRENGFAILVKSSSVTNNGWCPVYNIDEDHLQEIVKEVLSTDTKLLESIGENARQQFLENDKKFKERLNHIFLH